MQDLPHHYKVSANATPDSLVNLESEGAQALQSAAPAEFGGPGDQWSPETLLTAAVADCFILSFKAIARASKLDWQTLRCHATGTLARVERVTRFTDFALHAQLRLPTGGDADKAKRLLEKAEASCLVTNSMTVDVHLETDIQIGS